MPHLVLEYQADIELRHDLQALCADLFTALQAHPAIPHPASVKVRAAPCPYAYIGTEPQSFVHATLFLLEGRDTATKADLTQLVLNRMSAALSDVGSLSVDTQDMVKATYAKRVL